MRVWHTCCVVRWLHRIEGRVSNPLRVLFVYIRDRIAFRYEGTPYPIRMWSDIGTALAEEMEE